LNLIFRVFGGWRGATWAFSSKNTDSTRRKLASSPSCGSNTETAPLLLTPAVVDGTRVEVIEWVRGPNQK
jgi:hypothetical protein